LWIRHDQKRAQTHQPQKKKKKKKKGRKHEREVVKRGEI
jgi:hypothetical protein